MVDNVFARDFGQPASASATVVVYANNSFERNRRHGNSSVSRARTLINHQNFEDNVMGHVVNARRTRHKLLSKRTYIIKSETLTLAHN